jgi:hypothetical protein
VSFSGRNENLSEPERRARRYTLSHLAHDLEAQLGAVAPMRDWFPLSALGPFGDLTDLLLAKSADFGALGCACHPDCGVGTALLVHKATKQMVPLSRVVDLEGLLSDVREIVDAAQPRFVTLAELGVAVCRRFNASEAPSGFGLATLLRQLVSQTGARGTAVGDHADDADEFEWRILFVAGMWFQDLFNYDFRRTEMCMIPCGTQEGEIGFCAYNSGVGWRALIEKMHATARLGDWVQEHGRHDVYAKKQRLPLSPSLGTVRLPVLE